MFLRISVCVRAVFAEPEETACTRGRRLPMGGVNSLGFVVMEWEGATSDVGQLRKCESSK